LWDFSQPLELGPQNRSQRYSIGYTEESYLEDIVWGKRENGTDSFYPLKHNILKIAFLGVPN
jgi:hypothetical protein